MSAIACHDHGDCFSGADQQSSRAAEQHYPEDKCHTDDERRRSRSSGAEAAEEVTVVMGCVKQ